MKLMCMTFAAEKQMWRQSCLTDWGNVRDKNKKE
jgi:hypothetical protein